MRVAIEARRDEEGRLVGVLEAGNHERRAFVGVLELVGLIERELGDGRSDAHFPSQDERGG